MGWWFGRILTFEVVADDAPPTVGQILGDAADGAIQEGGDQAIVGYAAYGVSVRSAVGPLVDTFSVDLFDDGEQLRLAATAYTVSEADLGNGADGEPAAKIERELAPAREAPAALRLSYYDPALDYQSGEARASSGEQPGKEERIEVPAVLDSGVAKSLVQDLMSRRWAKRDKLTVRLPPRFLSLEPGAQLEVPASPSRWIVGTCAIDAFVAVAELWPARGSAAALVADAGRIVGNPDGAAGEPVLALMETPAGLSPNQASLMLAASSPVAGWKSRAVELNLSGQLSTLRTAARKSRLGRAASDQPAGEAYDIVDTVDIELIDDSQWLTSCDDAALASGANMAIIGKELVQFGDAIPLAPGKFRLGRLLRGRDGTEVAMTGHVAGEWFVLVEADALRMIGLPPWAIGSEVVVTALGVGAGSSEARATIGTEASRPLRGSALLLDGIQVVGERRPAIPSPSGGTTMDAEARSAIDAVLTALRQHGLIEM